MLQLFLTEFLIENKIMPFAKRISENKQEISHALLFLCKNSIIHKLCKTILENPGNKIEGLRRFTIRHTKVQYFQFHLK
jgi:hypothetical protein